MENVSWFNDEIKWFLAHRQRKNSTDKRIIKINIYRDKTNGNDSVSFTFNNEIVKEFFPANKAIVGYSASENRIYFANSKDKGYSISKKSESNKANRYLRVYGDDLVKICENRLGEYVISFDGERNILFINLNNNVEGFRDA